MVVTYCDRTQKEWKTLSVCCLQEAKCSHQGGSFIITFYGIHFGSNIWSRDVHIDGHVQWLQPNHDRIVIPTKNIIHH